jgi:hypothetical protein
MGCNAIGQMLLSLDMDLQLRAHSYKVRIMCTTYFQRLHTQNCVFSYSSVFQTNPRIAGGPWPFARWSAAVSEEKALQNCVRH